MDASTRARFEAKVDRSAGPDACHMWTANRYAGTGYGCFWVPGVGLRGAHRVAAMMAGIDVRSGMYVCHRCDTPACVNVAHLFVGTPRENALDREQKGRGGDRRYRTSRRGDLAPNALLTWPKAREIRTLRGAGWSWAELAKRFGVATATARKVVLGLTWVE